MNSYIQNKGLQSVISEPEAFRGQRQKTELRNLLRIKYLIDIFPLTYKLTLSYTPVVKRECLST